MSEMRRWAAGVWTAAVLVAGGGVVPLSAAPKGPAASVVKVRLLDAKTANGQPAQEVLVDWKNTGGVPIRKVKADIKPFDKGGAPLKSGASDYMIFLVGDQKPGVLPGKTYQEPVKQGFLLLPFMAGGKKAARVEIKLTTVAEKSGW